MSTSAERLYSMVPPALISALAAFVVWQNFYSSPTELPELGNFLHNHDSHSYDIEGKLKELNENSDAGTEYVSHRTPGNPCRVTGGPHIIDAFLPIKGRDAQNCVLCNQPLLS